MIDVLCGYEIENDHEQRGAVMLRVVDESQIAPEFDLQMQLRLIRGEFVRPIYGWRMTFWRTRDYLEDSIKQFSIRKATIGSSNLWTK